MDVDVTTGGLPLAGRRRVQQLSKDEWREALQQQMREKEEQKKAHTRSARPQPTESNNQAHENQENGDSSVAEQPQDRDEYPQGTQTSGTRPGGRRFVRAMSADEWKASLEEQIREKERQRQSRTRTAPDVCANDLPAIPERVIATAEPATTPSSTGMPFITAGDASCPVVGGRRRGTQPQQTREEYLRGLQEQIELKKKREEAEQQAGTKTRGRHCHRRVVEDDDGDGFWPPLPASSGAPIVQPSQPVNPVPVDENLSQAGALQELQETTTSDMAGSIEMKPASPQRAPTPTAVVTLDPTALAKLVELCEGMKQQNDELKQQLREQQSVLETLTEKAAVVEIPSTSKASTQASNKKPPSTGVRKPALQTPAANMRPIERWRGTVRSSANPTALPRVGKSVEIPPHDPIKRQPKLPVESTQSDEVTPAGEGAPVATTLKTIPANVAKQSRLPQPRVIARIRAAQRSSAPAQVPLSATAPQTLEVHRPRTPLPEAGADTANVAGSNPESSLGAARDECSHGISEGRLVLADDLRRNDRLPRLEPSPPINIMKKPTRAEALQSLSLPPIHAHKNTCTSDSELGTDDCLDSTSSTCAMSVAQFVRGSLGTSRHFDRDLEACSSSIPMLDGPSAIVPCESDFGYFSV